MGRNNLYFYFWRASDNYYGATIKSIELYFTAESEFQAEGLPGTPSQIISEGVNMVGAEFTTGKLDLGLIQPNSKSGVTYFSYNYENVVDLTAQNWLYQEEAVVNGKLPETARSGNIQVLQNDGQLYYALGNGTYYIETPTETKNQNGKTIPLGFRITGAQINAHYGTQASASTITFKGVRGTISYESGSGWWATTYYLQTDATWDTSPQTEWTLTTNGKLKSDNTYLYVQNSGSQYILDETTDQAQASTFTVSDGRVMWGDTYLSYYSTSYSTSRARFTSSTTRAATWNSLSETVTNPAYNPSAFTLNLYGTSGDKVESATNVSTDNKDATLTVSSLNNDAVKFTISGLAEGTKALITYNLTMEQLNPFINTLDIVLHSKKVEGATIMQQFTSNDFQVAGGAFHFYVPSDYNNCRFTFENLTSKYMDETYGHGTKGNGRNYFVKSAYYNKYGDGKQYNTTGNEEASTKVITAMCGDQPFKYNNAHELANDNLKATAATLEEYPYSEALYTAADGSGTSTGVPGTFTEDIELTVNGAAKNCYLFTGDETRYNIAPTTAMEHRAYAFYLMQIDLQVKEYDAYCKLVKLYNATYYGDGQEKAMYGGSFEAYEKGHAGETGYQIHSDETFLTLSMMKQALDEAKARENIDLNQILYLDHTELYSVLLENMKSMASLKAELNPNCLIFFPERSVYSADNFVSKTMSGDFRACKNIVITDKQPFYSPYKITVPAENYAAYSRKITNPMNGKATLATLMLPFSVELAGGVHTNTKGDCSFEVYRMVSDNGLSIDAETGPTGTDFWGKANYVKVDDVRTTPNVPYMVKVTKTSADENTSFEVVQYGSDLEATTDISSDYTFAGETSSGTIAQSPYTFTHYGSYSGKKLPKANGWFYFSQGKFYNSKNLSSKYDYVYVLPFRGYFAYEGNPKGKNMTGFTVNFDEGWTTGLDDVVSSSNADSALRITTSQGVMAIAASERTPVSVVSVSGTGICRALLAPGEVRTLSLSPGLYIVNGKKVVIP